MTKEEFWSTIETARQAVPDGSQSMMAEQIYRELLQKPPEDILDWNLYFYEYRDAACRNDLQAASTALGVPATSDGFLDFRTWLVAQGKEIYLAAIDNPDTLAKDPHIGAEMSFPSFADCAVDAYAEKLSLADEEERRRLYNALNHHILMGQLLLPLIVAIQVRLVITGTGGAAQTVAVAVCLHHIAEAAPVLGDSSAVLGAEATHRRQILQWSIRPEGIHDGLKFILELRDIELILVVGPPGVPEFFSVVTEVHSDMPHGTQCLVLFRVQFRTEKARLLKGSGPQLDSVFTCSYSALIQGFHLLSLVSTQHTTPCKKYLLHFHHPRICSEFAAINVTSLVPVRGCHALPDFE